MQKTNKTTQPKYVSIGAFVIAVAAGMHVSGASHLNMSEKHTNTSGRLSHALNQHLERESETSRHLVRFDEAFRTPTTSGGKV